MLGANYFLDSEFCNADYKFLGYNQNQQKSLDDNVQNINKNTMLDNNVQVIISKLKGFFVIQTRKLKRRSK